MGVRNSRLSNRRRIGIASKLKQLQTKRGLSWFLRNDCPGFPKTEGKKTEGKTVLVFALNKLADNAIIEKAPRLLSQREWGILGASKNF